MVSRLLPLASAGILFAAPALAADLATPAALPATCKTALTFPAFGGLIKPDPTPACVTIGGLGDIYIGGAITGYGYGAKNPFPASTTGLPGDAGSRADFSNLQVFLQKPDGVIQLYAQFGAYASPGLGAANFSTLDQTRLLYGPAPVVYGKLQVNDDWSLQGGRMPTLIGTEAPFTFQNLDIERGLLFAQENVINQGVQLNYAHGPWSASVAGTDGFFSGEISWFSGAVTYKIDDADTVGINGGLNLGRTDVASRRAEYQFTTPLNQQNSGILDINYTYANGPWTVTPYVQFTNVEKDTGLGIAQSASTFGGAVLAAYAFDATWGLAGRLEVEGQTGQRGSGTTSLLYGPGSSAVSATITPTYTKDRFFAHVEYSHVELFDAAEGLGFGRNGTKSGQDSFMAEGGITF